MSTLRDRGQAALIGRMKQSAGVSVTYTRGGQQVTLTVWVGQTQFTRTTDDPGASVVTAERDYLIGAQDLAAAGIAGTPRRGDKITETIAGTAYTFELQPSAGEPEWRYSDQARTTYRVHVKRPPQ